MKRYSLTVLPVVLAVLAWLLVPIGIVAQADGPKPDKLERIHQFSLGDPDGDPNGNPFFAGSTDDYLNRLQEVLAGEKFKQKKYAPEEASVWGPGGEFGGELYFLVVLERLPKGSLLVEENVLRFRFTQGPLEGECFGFPVDEGWCVFFSGGPTGTYVYPMEAYDHTAGASSNVFRTLHFGEECGLDPSADDIGGSACGNDTRTFASFRSIAGDFSDCIAPGGCGSANNPPDLSEMCGFQARRDSSYKLVTGDWVLSGAGVGLPAPQGYIRGTGYSDGGGGIVEKDLGSKKAVSKVVC